LLQKCILFDQISAPWLPPSLTPALLAANF